MNTAKQLNVAYRTTCSWKGWSKSHWITFRGLFNSCRWSLVQNDKKLVTGLLLLRLERQENPWRRCRPPHPQLTFTTDFVVGGTLATVSKGRWTIAGGTVISQDHGNVCREPQMNVNTHDISPVEGHTHVLQGGHIPRGSSSTSNDHPRTSGVPRKKRTENSQQAPGGLPIIKPSSATSKAPCPVRQTLKLLIETVKRIRHDHSSDSER